MVCDVAFRKGIEVTGLMWTLTCFESRLRRVSRCTKRVQFELSIMATRLRPPSSVREVN